VPVIAISPAWLSSEIVATTAPPFCMGPRFGACGRFGIARSRGRSGGRSSAAQCLCRSCWFQGQCASRSWVLPIGLEPVWRADHRLSTVGRLRDNITSSRKPLSRVTIKRWAHRHHISADLWTRIGDVHAHAASRRNRRHLCAADHVAKIHPRRIALFEWGATLSTRG